MKVEAYALISYDPIVTKLGGIAVIEPMDGEDELAIYRTKELAEAHRFPLERVQRIVIEIPEATA